MQQENTNMETKQGQEVSAMEQLLKDSKKRTAYARVIAACAVCFLVIVVIAFLKLVPQALHTLDSVNNAVASAEDALEQVEQMSMSITDTSENLNAFVMDNSELVSDAVTNISSVDYETLNEAIGDLRDTVEPFANFMNRFR